MTQNYEVRSKVQVKIIKNVNNNYFENANLYIINFGVYVFNTTHIFGDIFIFTILYYKKLIEYILLLCKILEDITFFELILEFF